MFKSTQLYKEIRAVQCDRSCSAQAGVCVCVC